MLSADCLFMAYDLNTLAQQCSQACESYKATIRIAQESKLITCTERFQKLESDVQGLLG